MSTDIDEVVEDGGALAANLKWTFRDWDKKGTGCIGISRLKGVLKKLDASLGDDQLDQLILACDRNGDGKIQYAEFIDFLGELKGPVVQAESKESKKWKKPSSISEEACRMLWEVFDDIDLDNDGSVTKQATVFYLKEHRSKDVCKALVKELKEVLAGDENAKSIFSSLARMEDRLSNPALIDRFEELKEDRIGIRIFVKLVWPAMPDRDQNGIMRLMRKFKAQSRLRDVFRAAVNGEATQLSAADVKFLFEELDVNDDGAVSKRDLVKVGALTEDEADQLSEVLDAYPRNGTLSVQELMQVVTKQAVSSFATGLKGMFATSQQ